jgi:anaerobic ribonucleoside-triphosphate reductase activating protein
MKLAVNRIHFPVTTLGYGRRVGIWTQGCSIRCSGCISKDTWESGPEFLIETDELLVGCDKWLMRCDGVSISGGEPFDQPDGLAQLITELRRRMIGDILVYSGFNHRRLFEQFPEIISQLDVLVSEPYVESAGDSLVLRGSDNQRIFLLTELARQRYPADIDQRGWDGQRRLDLVVLGDEIWMAGIPRRGEMTRLRDELRRVGVECETSDEDDERDPIVRA